MSQDRLQTFDLWEITSASRVIGMILSWLLLLPLVAGLGTGLSCCLHQGVECDELIVSCSRNSGRSNFSTGSSGILVGEVGAVFSWFVVLQSWLGD